MKVLIDGHMLGKNEGGNERYIKNLSLNLINLIEPDKIDLKILVSNPYYQEVKNNKRLRNYLIKQESDSDVLRLLYSLPKTAKSFKADIVHSTYIVPFFKNAKFVVTVHDFSFKHYPGFYTPRERLIFKYLLPISLKMANAVVVPSNFTKNEALKFYPYLDKKIFVTYEAADNVFKALDRNRACSFLYKKYSIARPFLLTLNAKNPKKNINRVIEAYLHLRNRFSTLKLVIIGGDFNLDKIREKLKGVVILPNINDEELNLFYNACEIFVYFSLYEGFGLPLIEALKCKIPVIASNTEVHREVSKRSIIYADPYNTKELSARIKLLLTDNSLRKSFVAAGYQVASSYSWKQTAKLTFEIYKSILDKK